MPRLLRTIFPIMAHGFDPRRIGSGPSRARISRRTEGGSMEQAVGPERSIVVYSSWMSLGSVWSRLRTWPTGSGDPLAEVSARLPASRHPVRDSPLEVFGPQGIRYRGVRYSSVSCCGRSHREQGGHHGSHHRRRSRRSRTDCR